VISRAPMVCLGQCSTSLPRFNIQQVSSHIPQHRLRLMLIITLYDTVEMLSTKSDRSP
jgi:hypothetical protein